MPLRERSFVCFRRRGISRARRSTVERSPREDQEKFYEQNTFKDFNDLKQKLKRWNIYYNDLEHCGLNGKSPNEFLREY